VPKSTFVGSNKGGFGDCRAQRICINTEFGHCKRRKVSPHPPLFEDVRGFETLTIRDPVPKATTSMVTEFPNKVVRPETRSNACTPLSEWESLTPRGIPPEMQLRSRPTTSSKIAVARSSTLELTRFQRFIRRMESAGPRVVLDRLTKRYVPQDTCSKTSPNPRLAGARKAALAADRLPNAKPKQDSVHPETDL
jgi:hypothetical protein